MFFVVTLGQYASYKCFHGGQSSAFLGCSFKRKRIETTTAKQYAQSISQVGVVACCPGVSNAPSGNSRPNLVVQTNKKTKQKHKENTELLNDPKHPCIWYIFAYIYHTKINHSCIGKYTSPMDAMGDNVYLKHDMAEPSTSEFTWWGHQVQCKAALKNPDPSLE